MIEIKSNPGERIQNVFMRAFDTHINITPETIEESANKSKIANEFIDIPKKDVEFYFNDSHIILIGD